MTERLRIDPGALIRARAARGLTQAEVGARAGIPRHMISDYERRERLVLVPVAKAIAAALRVSPAEIVVNYQDRAAS